MHTNVANMNIEVIVKWDDETAAFEIAYAENGMRYGDVSAGKINSWATKLLIKI